MRLGLSNRKHLPVLKTDLCEEKSFFLWEYKWVQRIERTGLKLTPWGFAALKELYEFGEHYLPPFPLNGLTVLDVGACCGETAWFFLKHGAKKVICIEPNPEQAKLIRENQKNKNLNLEVIEDIFRPKEHLSIPHDFIKCDIEGYEMELLPYAQTLKPCVVEAHTGWIKEQFEKHGFRPIMVSAPNIIVINCLMVNWK